MRSARTGRLWAATGRFRRCRPAPGSAAVGQSAAGNGTPAHLAGELLKIEAKLDMTHVAYRGTGPALQDVIAGHIQMAFSPAAPVVTHFPGFEATTWHGIVAPAGTPRGVVAALHRAMNEALNDPETRNALTNLGVDVVANTPDEFRAYIRSEIPKWAAIVRASGAKLE